MKARRLKTRLAIESGVNYLRHPGGGWAGGFHWSVNKLSPWWGLRRHDRRHPPGQNQRVLASGDITLPVEQWSELTNGTFGVLPVTFTEIFGDPPPTNRFYRIASP
jgi:hypothetical protein